MGLATSASLESAPSKPTRLSAPDPPQRPEERERQPWGQLCVETEEHSQSSCFERWCQRNGIAIDGHCTSSTTPAQYKPRHVELGFTGLTLTTRASLFWRGEIISHPYD